MKAAGRLSSHPYLTLALVFSVTLWVFCWATGSFSDVPATVFLLAVTLTTVLCVWTPRGRPWLALIIVGMSYEVISGPIDGIANSKGAFSMFGIDQQLWGTNLTGLVQKSYSSQLLTDVTSLLYLSLIPLVGAVALILWHYNKDGFHRYIISVGLTSYFALITFLLLPTSPPWYTGAAQNLVASSGMGAAASVLSPLGSVVQPDFFAAFPSLHAAYTITCAYFLFKIGRGWGLVGGAIALATLFSTLYLGQHYAVDLIGGAVYSLVPCLITERMNVAQFSARLVAGTKSPLVD